MNLSKVLLATLAGGVVNFLLGWLVYVKLMAGFFAANAGSGSGCMRGEDDMSMMWALIVGNLGYALLLAYIFSKWAGIRTAMTGMTAGATIAGLVAFAVDFTMLGVANINNLNSAIVDVLVSAVLGAACGAVVGWVLGYGENRG